MRIGIDCRTILNPEKGEAAGVGHYTYQLVKNLSSLANGDQINGEHTLVLFFDREVGPERLKQFEGPAVEIKHFPFLEYKEFLPIAYSHLLVTAFLKREKIDLFHSPIPHLPLSWRDPAVVTVHDLAIYKYPHLFPAGQFLSTKVIVPRTLERAKKIIAVSNATKHDIQELFSIPDERIEVIYHGLDRRFFESPDEETLARTRRKYNIKKPYFLFVGSLEPRKNLERLVAAFEKFHEKYGDTHQLVLVGREGPAASRVYALAMASPARADILFTGYVEPDNIGLLMHGATALTAPSIYEGFGMPVTEALAAGIPVITSRFGSLAEVSGETAIFIDPYNVDDIAAAMGRVVDDPTLTQRARHDGPEIARRYSWEECAKKTFEVYQSSVE